MSTDIMLDLETTGVSAGCGILAIGACSFSEDYKFYEKIALSSLSRFPGFFSDGSTMAWWDRQAPDAREEAFSGTTDIITALGKFSDWFQAIPEAKKVKYIWGNGADFDLPILAAAYEACKIEKPWKPYNGRCYRTIKNLHSDVPLNSFRGVKHNALEDAKNQAIHLMKIVNAKGLNLG